MRNQLNLSPRNQLNLSQMNQNLIKSIVAQKSLVKISLMMSRKKRRKMVKERKMKKTVMSMSPQLENCHQMKEKRYPQNILLSQL
jgi:hypothetical protein